MFFCSSSDDQLKLFVFCLYIISSKDICVDFVFVLFFCCFYSVQNSFFFLFQKHKLSPLKSKIVIFDFRKTISYNELISPVNTQQWPLACIVLVVRQKRKFDRQRFDLNRNSTLDYVYFEGNPSEPFLIRRIEELNKV